MLELTYSNRTEALLQRLAERVRAQREGDPFEPIHLVVPNPHLKEYLRLGLASELGIAANLRFSYLAGLWRDLLPAQEARILDFDRLRAALMGVLDDRDLLAAKGLEPVRAYLGEDGAPMKRLQLAGELARVLEEYQLSRADWIQAWREERPARTPDGAMEAWQSRLWREAVRRLDAASKAEHLTLLEQVRRSRLEGSGLPRAIHAFALSHVAQAYQEVYRAFGALAETTLHLYALNPCEEFWEDLSADRRTLWAPQRPREEARLGPWDGASEDFYGLEGLGPRALRFWGRPGRENIRLLNEVSDCDFVSAFEAPLAPTLLAQIQRDLLLFQDPPEGPGADPDASVRCVAAPSLRREAEIVASGIWNLLEAQGRTRHPLRFSDIAVAVPPGEHEAYRAHLEAAFQDAHGLPLVQSDRALPVMRQTLEAVQALLDLPSSGLTRAALLRVLLHPALQRRFPELDTEAWARWCETLGIVRGTDRQDWTGTYLDQDALNWDQGLRRLALGAFMAEDSEFESGGERYRIPGPQEERSVAVFTALVRGLTSDARDLLRARTGPRDWLKRIWRYLERWLQVDEGEEAEAALKALERIRTFLERTFEGLPEGLELPLLDFPAARHLALEALARLENEQPANLAKGVIIGTYASLRAIPFRALFLMGLGEGSYPTRNHRSALDLRSRERRPGDVSQTEKEKYLFLELLLSAREHLTLSHVALDELSGEALEPSGLFKEFRALLGDYLAPAWAPAPGEEDPLLERHPLRRFDPAYFPAWFPETAKPSPRTHSETAQAEARALWLGEQARACGLPMPQALGDLLLPAPDRERLRMALGSLAAPEVPAERPLIRIGLQDLKAFLECPLSGAAAVRLGLRRLSLEDRAAVRDEPFESDFLEAWSLQREVALGCLREGGDPETVYDQGLRRLQARGEAPFGIFSEVEKRSHLQPIQAWVDHLRGLGPDGPVFWRLGTRPFGSGPVDHPCPPLALTATPAGQPQRVELSGDLRPQLGGSLFLEEGQPPGPSDLSGLHRKALGAYLDHLVLTCVDPGHRDHRARFVFSASVTRRGRKEPTREISLAFPALTREQALAQLADWIEDLLSGDHGVLMPIEAVLRHAPMGTLTPETILAYVEEQTEKQERASFSTLNGPVPDPLRFAPPEDPMALARRRLGGFLEALASQEEAD